MINISLKTIIEAIEQKELLYNQHAETLKSNILLVRDYFKGKFSFSFEGEVFYESDSRDDLNYSYCLRTSRDNGFEVIKRWDDGDINILQLGDLSEKMLRLIVEKEAIQKLLEVYLSEVTRIESLYINASSQSQILKDEIYNDVICEKL